MLSSPDRCCGSRPVLIANANLHRLNVELFRCVSCEAHYWQEHWYVRAWVGAMARYCAEQLPLLRKQAAAEAYASPAAPGPVRLFTSGSGGELLVYGGEAIAIREQIISAGLYLDFLPYLEDVQKAVVLCACGLGEAEIQVAGRMAQAASHVAALDLEQFVAVRMSAWAN